MTNLRYKAFSDTRFEIVGKDEEILASVECGDDGLWRIVPKPGWVHGDARLGPFNTSEEALEELGADTADQS